MNPLSRIPSQLWSYCVELRVHKAFLEGGAEGSEQNNSCECGIDNLTMPTGSAPSPYER